MRKQYYHSHKVLIGFILLLSLVNIKILYANPQGGSVTGGNATITNVSNNDLVVTQESGQAVIDWNSFNIGAHDRMVFMQPSARAAILNRVHDSNPSEILGTLLANGEVFIVNGSGVLFGSSANVNVGSLVASTADINNKNFMAGHYQFVQAPPAAAATSATGSHGAVINEGHLNSRYGLIALLGSGVQNNGVIQADLGNVVLGAASEYTLAFDGERLINFSVGEKVTQPAVDEHGAKLSDGIKNTGSIVADGGKILVSAEVAKDVVDNAINLQGVLQAHAVAQHGGEIILSGGHEGIVNVGGRIDASGHGVQGGKVKITGKDILINSSSVIDASGDEGGGEILIGGNFHGVNITDGNQVFNNAIATVIQPGAILNADAINQGNGGNVVVWSDQVTKFYGNIFARGGLLSGNGGAVETSGHYLDITNGTVNTLAPVGKTGTWLLDPSNVTISSDPNSNINYSNGIFSPNTAEINNCNINVNDLVAKLGTSNIIVNTESGAPVAGNITVVSSFSWSSPNSLTLNAVGQIIINAPISSTASGASLNLNAGSGIAINANITLGGNLIANSTNGIATTIAANVITAGSQTYNNPVIATSSPTLTGNNIKFVQGASGAINIAGSGSNSILTYTTGNNVWNITGNNSGNVASLSFSGINNIAGGAGDSLRDTLGNTTWNITGNNAVSVAGINFSSTSINNLSGGSNDIFMLSNNASLSGSISDSANNATLNYINYSGSAQVLLNTGNSGTATGISGGFSGVNNLIGGLNVTLSVNSSLNAQFVPNGTSGQITINGVLFNYSGVNVPQAIPTPTTTDIILSNNNNINGATISGVNQTSAIGATGFSSTASSSMGGSTPAEQSLLAVQAANTAANNATTALKNSQDNQDIKQQDQQKFSNCS